MKSIMDKDAFSPFKYRRDLVPTISTIELLNTIAQWIMNGVPGGMVYGFSRAGKSSAITLISQTLQDYLKLNWPCFIFTTVEGRGTTINTFFEHCLEDIRHIDPSAGNAQTKRRNLINSIVASCHHNHSNDVIIFIDDAQWLVESQYAWIIDIHTQLINRDIRPLVILVGQQELKDTPAVLRGALQWPSVGRFMQETFHFRGVEGIDDIDRLLEALDSCVPADETSEQSYTQLAVGKAYKAGFRLTDNKETIWDGILAARHEKTGGIPFDECPMQVAWPGLIGLLGDLSDNDSKSLKLNEDVVKKAFLQYGGSMLGVTYN